MLKRPWPLPSALLAAALVAGTAGAALARPEPAEAKFPAECYRMPTARADTVALVCKRKVHRLEQRTSGGVVIVWP